MQAVGQDIHPSPDPRSRPQEFQAKYSEYLDPEMPLEDRFRTIAHEIGVQPEDLEGIFEMLGPLKAKHPPTYHHCLRVGILAQKIGSFLQLDEKALFMAGALHDAGKAAVDFYLLDKIEGWNEQDSKLMARHVEESWKLLQGRFDFCAEIVKHHHRFQPNGYPQRVPKALHEYSLASSSHALRLGRLIALADVYDSLHRVNSRHGELRAQTGEEIKEKMFQFSPDMEPQVEQLYHSGAFSTFVLGSPNEETLRLDEGDSLYEESFRYTDTHRTPLNTQRAVAVACALEPLSDKFNCTTRRKDVSRHLKLPYFIAAGINIGDAFREMGQLLKDSEVVPSGVYRFAERAQLESKRNRRGGRVNAGMIELLVPIVAAQHLHDPDYAMSPKEILQLASDFMRRTARADVDGLISAKHIAYQLSHQERKVPVYPEAATVAEYYERDLLESQTPTSRVHNQEFVAGFPTVELICDVIRNSPYPHLDQRVEEAYLRARAIHGKEVGPGVTADHIAAGLYLVLSQFPRERVIG